MDGDKNLRKNEKKEETKKKGKENRIKNGG